MNLKVCIQPIHLQRSSCAASAFLRVGLALALTIPLLSACGPSKAEREATMAQKIAAKIAADQAAEEAAAKKQAALDEAAARHAAEASSRADEEALAQLREKLLSTLNDPASAQFRNLTLRSNGTVLCGDVNAKNGFGGYVGFRPFIAVPEGAAIWSGSCTGRGDIDAQIACASAQNNYILPARRLGCKTQDEIDILVGRR